MKKQQLSTQPTKPETRVKRYNLGSIRALLVGSMMFQSFLFAQGGNLWIETSVKEGIPAELDPERCKIFELDEQMLVEKLRHAPIEFTSSPTHRISIDLPLPDGSLQAFDVFESPIMAPELSARYPELRTYAARGGTNRILSARLDMTPAGFHAIIFTGKGTIYIDPIGQSPIGAYVCYDKKDFVPGAERSGVELGPFGAEDDAVIGIRSILESGILRSSSIGEELRTYRLAVAATGEYTQYHGGTVEAGMAAIVTAMNRVNGIYEREVSVRMVLIAGNDAIVFANPLTDPYTNNDGFVMLGQNQTTIDNVIGSANYDVGHVFSTGGGGVAFLAVPCRTGVKARGVTGAPVPVGDPFYVDYVAHEMGHQFGANHSFNGTAGACGGNGNPSTAYEPGSASTIMGYAGICGSHDLQSNSDDYFHGVSIDEIVAYTQFGAGNGCAAITSTGNTPPQSFAGDVVYTIPLGTPFVLTGSGLDPDNDSLTFCWEEFDLGPAGDPNNPAGNAPIFRSFNPTESPSRIFPRLSDIVSGSQTIGEIMPEYARTLNFRLTARDNRLGGGGIGTDETSVIVTDQSGPFAVTSPNEPTVWLVNSTESVTWDVANSDMPPVSCPSVNILLSRDGGTTFTDTLSEMTANDGLESITVPGDIITNARIKVESANNIFFDISNADLLVSDLALPVLLFPADSSENLPEPIELVWNSVNSATSYHVQVSVHAGFSFGRIVDDSTYADTVRSVTGVSANRRYYWRVRPRNSSGDGLWSDVWTFVTGPLTAVEEDLVVFPVHRLDQNFPNPFNPSTRIPFAVGSRSMVNITVFDILGRQVAVVVHEVLPPGSYSRTWDAGNLPSGVYVYRLSAGRHVETRKLLLLR